MHSSHYHAPAEPWAECQRLLKCAAYAEATEAEDFTGFQSGNELKTTGLAALSTGLGHEVDSELLQGGLHPGEICEIFGAAGSGKTQIALSVAAHCALAGNSVVYVTNKDSPTHLAIRLWAMMNARAPAAGALETALGRCNFIFVNDFPTFARVVTIDDANPQVPEQPSLFVIDTLSSLLYPYATWAGRWRFAWVWRALRRLATKNGVCVLLLSQTSGAQPGKGVLGSQRLALGQLWTGAATTRLEILGDRATFGSQSLRLALRKSARRDTEHGSVELMMGEAGVVSPPVSLSVVADGV